MEIVTVEEKSQNVVTQYISTYSVIWYAFTCRMRILCANIPSAISPVCVCVWRVSITGKRGENAVAFHFPMVSNTCASPSPCQQLYLRRMVVVKFHGTHTHIHTTNASACFVYPFISNERQANEYFCVLFVRLQWQIHLI